MKTKSILLIIVLTMLGALSIKAQSLTLSYNGGDVSNGVIDVEGLASAADIKVAFSITNTSESAISVKVKKNVRQDIEGSVNTFCFGACFPPETVESPDEYPIGAGATLGPDIFYVQLYPEGNSGVAQIVYEVFNVANPEDKVSITVNFTIQPTGIALNAKDIFLRAYPNPTLGEYVFVEYSLPNGVSKASFTLYNMLGVRVHGMAIENRSGKIEISTNSLPKGIYLYSIEANGNRLATKRLIVK